MAVRISLLLACLALPTGCLDAPAYGPPGSPATDTGGLPSDAADTGGLPSDAADAHDAGGAMLGSVGGNVSLGAGVACGEPPDDCLGTLYVFVTELDPTVTIVQEPLYMLKVPGAEIADGRTESYLAEGLPPGSAWLTGFLDDDFNAPTLGPLPDRGDPTRYPPLEVTLEPGVRTAQDLVLNVRNPL